MIMTSNLLQQWLQTYQTAVEQAQEYLDELDTAIGDGDHGHNMVRGMQAVAKTLETTPATLSAGLKQVAMALISHVGGASGPLYGSAFLAMAKASQEPAAFETLIPVGAAAIAQRGGAQPGDKTMLDVWAAMPALTTAAAWSQADFKALAAATAPLVAKKGRASYLGERAIGHVDPGAASSALLFEALQLVLEREAIQ